MLICSICLRGGNGIRAALRTPFPQGIRGSNPLGGTIRELIGFLEAKMRDARSASQGFPPNFPNEFRIFGALARTNFSPRDRFEPKISLALTFFSKRSESEAILSKDCASFIHSFIGSSQSFCLCEREVISSWSDFFSDNNFAFRFR